MNFPSSSPLASKSSPLDQHAISQQPAKPANETQEAFTDFVGQTLFGSMLDSMRKTVGKPAYMHGGRTEEVFQQQMDQLIVEDLTEASASSIADPMYQLFQMSRSA
ncbi:rod-binding protein [Novipirellula sp.]|uniref:rod-binding protein n=1 Tax=Novipirellula sp. TaxID=2795430 RepID=UPI00356397C1